MLLYLADQLRRVEIQHSIKINDLTDDLLHMKVKGNRSNALTNANGRPTWSIEYIGICRESLFGTDELFEVRELFCRHLVCVCWSWVFSAFHLGYVKVRSAGSNNGDV